LYKTFFLFSSFGFLIYLTELKTKINTATVKNKKNPDIINFITKIFSLKYNSKSSALIPNVVKKNITTNGKTKIVQTIQYIIS
jgi:hypothetical protein